MATTTNTTTDYASVIDALVESGFEPTDQPAALVVAPGRCGSLPVAGADLRRKLQATVSYFAARGWDAVRLDPDELTFVRFSDEGHRITTTTASGVITAEATFSASPSGTRLFLAAAAA